MAAKDPRAIGDRVHSSTATGRGGSHRTVNTSAATGRNRSAPVQGCGRYNACSRLEPKIPLTSMCSGSRTRPVNHKTYSKEPTTTLIAKSGSHIQLPTTHSDVSFEWNEQESNLRTFAENNIMPPATYTTLASNDDELIVGIGVDNYVPPDTTMPISAINFDQDSTSRRASQSVQHLQNHTQSDFARVPPDSLAKSASFRMDNVAINGARKSTRPVNHYRGNDPIKKMVQNKKLQALLADKPMPKARKKLKEDGMELRIGLTKVLK